MINVDPPSCKQSQTMPGRGSPFLLQGHTGQMGLEPLYPDSLVMVLPSSPQRMTEVII